MANYPIMLNLAGKKVVVVGGGKIAERKIIGLISAEANIVVVSPVISPEINRLVSAGNIIWQKKHFSQEDIEEAFMIFAATNDKALNQSIKEAAEVWQLVTIADDPDSSDFHVPAKLQRGRLTITISTGGASPTLARNIRDQLAKQFDEQYEDYLEFLFAARQQILQEVKNTSLKKQLLNLVASPDFLKSETRSQDFQSLYKKLIQSY